MLNLPSFNEILRDNVLPMLVVSTVLDKFKDFIV
jgi:hypothetical protein